MIQCKRVYDPQESSDGYRVLVDRLWPRGIKKEALACDEWCKELTPSAELRKAFHGEAIDFAHFSQAIVRSSTPIAKRACGWRRWRNASR